jgi:prevent-host-death family protein
MDVSVSAAKGQLTDLVKRAEAGETVLLTRRGEVVARIVPASSRRTTPRFQMDAIDEIVRAAKEKLKGQAFASSEDDMYDEFGAPK